MSSLNEADAATWTDTLEAIRAGAAKSATLEAAAATATRALFERFAATTALARVYAVVPNRELEPAVASFVAELAVKTGQQDKLRPETPVLTLLGTHGRKPEWCDRAQSVGHRGIPLISAAFVDAIPMLARLLKELGVELEGLDAAAELNARKLLGGFNGLFFVDDASSARDARGRLIIPAQDFVAEQGVKTVFGMGGVYPDGTLVVLIVFVRERLQRSQVERLTSLISLFKGETFGLVRTRKFFG